MLGQLVANQAQAEAASPFKSILAIANIGAVRKLTPEEIAAELAGSFGNGAIGGAGTANPTDIAYNDPTNIYATIRQDGQTIAIIYKGGGLAALNSSIAGDLDGSLQGMDLAKYRVDEILRHNGGATVSYGKSAINDAANASWEIPDIFWKRYHDHIGKS